MPGKSKKTVLRKTPGFLGDYTLYENIFRLARGRHVVDDQTLYMDETGNLLVNARIVLQFSPPTRIETLSMDERLELGMFTSYTVKQLRLRKGRDQVLVLKEANDAVYIKAFDRLKELRRRLRKLPGSSDLKHLVKYHEAVLAKFDLWYEANGIQPPCSASLTVGHVKGGGFEHERVKEIVNALRSENPNMSMKEAFEKVATDMDKTPESIRRNFYYKPKQ